MRRSRSSAPAPSSPRSWRWEAVLFDLDGTLADTVPLILAAYRHTMRTHRGRELPDRLWTELIGRPLRDSFREFAVDDDELEALQSTYLEFQRAVHDDMVRPMAGAREVVEELLARGTPLALVTSKRREMALRTLAVCGFDDVFEATVTADDVARGKPDPEAVRTALGLLAGVPAGRAVFVGDSPYDLRAGRAAGVRTVGVTTGPFDAARLRAEAPDHLVERLVDLPRGPE